MVKKSRFGLVGCGALLACNVSSTMATSGAAHFDAGSGGDGGPGSACPSALVVACNPNDFTATNIAVLSSTGAPLSQSIISSGSTAPGLSKTLSGDVILPLAPTPGKIVLIDQLPNTALTWVDPSTAAVIHQLNVGTGFAANPHDYLEVSATKAYVTRYESNMNPGQQAYDGGGDLLIIDPETATITGRVPFAADGAFLPRPDRMIRVGEEVWVSLQRFDANLMTAGDARVVGVSSADDSIQWVLDLPGVASCAGLARAPSGKVIALSCTGVLGDPDPKQRSAIVLIDATAHPPVELKRFAAASQLGAPLGFTLDYASEGMLVGVALGDLQAPRNDVAYTLDLASGTARVLADAGGAFAFGDVRCAPGCTDLCFLADAPGNALRVFRIASAVDGGSSLVALAPVPVDPSVGFPPRALGAF
jgi:hypothetical protein